MVYKLDSNSTRSGSFIGFLSGLLLARVITIYFGMMTVMRKNVSKVV